MYMLDAGSRRASYIIVHMRATSFINRLNSQRFIHSKVLKMWQNWVIYFGQSIYSDSKKN